MSLNKCELNSCILKVGVTPRVKTPPIILDFPPNFGLRTRNDGIQHCHYPLMIKDIILPFADTVPKQKINTVVSLMASVYNGSVSLRNCF